MCIRGIGVFQHHIVDDPDSIHGAAAGVGVVVDVNDDINQVVTRNHGAVGMIVTPDSGFAIDLNVFTPLQTLDELVGPQRWGRIHK